MQYSLFNLPAKEVKQHKNKIFKTIYVFIILLTYIYSVNYLLVLKVKHTKKNTIKVYCYILKEKLLVLYTYIFEYNKNGNIV
jgi:hypothetical protein